MTSGESITLRVATALEACGIPLLDWPYVEDWCRRHCTLPLLEEIRRSIPAA